MGAPKFNLVLCFSITSMVFLSSCMSGIVDEPSSESNITTEEVASSLGMMEEVDWILLSIMQRDLSQFKIAPILDAENCPGAVILRDEEQRTIWINFGEGCVSDRGVEKKGILKIQYTDHLLQKGAKINMVFESFYLNGHRMDGSRQVENLGFQAASKSMRFISEMRDFQITLENGKLLSLSQVYEKDLQFSNEETGFRIHLYGGGSMEMTEAKKLTFEILKPLLYKQECMFWGIPEPSEGSLELKFHGDESILFDFSGQGC